jgi:hypothetical protein
MATITELAAEILSSQASTSAMTTDELLASLQKNPSQLSLPKPV